VRKPLQKSRIPEGKAFVIKELNAPFFDVNWHFHAEYQLFVVLKGKGTRFIGDAIHTFEEGDLVLTGPNLPHLWRNDQAYFESNQALMTQGIVIYFSDHFLNNSVFELEEFASISRLLQDSLAGISILGKTREKAEKLMKSLLHKEGISGIVLLLELLDLLAKSAETQLITRPGYVNSHKESERDRMGLVYEMVMQNYGQKVTLKDAADICNLSESAFSRYFKSRANQSFSSFLSSVRIHQACKLLKEEKMNISQICFECGFFTLSNFNSQFKSQLGKTPKEYRNEFLR
jgi:AraC-like DNA-binding protein